MFIPDGLIFRSFPVRLAVSAEEKRALRSFVRTLSGRVAGSRAFTCLIADDSELRRLNRTFLGHNYPTDVLSFPSADHNLLGEMIISIERAQAQAAEFGHTRLDEIRILMLHGLLHLIGMDHEADSGEMAAAEQRWRNELDLPVTLIARSAEPAASLLS